MAIVKVKLEWNGEIEKEQMHQAMFRAMIRSTNLIQSKARLKSPVDEGNLRASIVTMVDKLGLIGIVSTNLEYAPFIEFGTGRFVAGGRSTPWVYKHPKYGFIRTVGHKAQPFLRPSLAESEEAIRKIFISEGSKAVA
jgi:HK97 gp10 family phage protein